MIHCRIGSYFLTLELTSWHGYNYIIVLKRFWSFQKVSARLGCDADTFSAHASRQSGSIPMDRIKTENFTTLQHKDTVLPVANLVDHQFYQCAGWLLGQILVRFYSTIVLADDTTMGGDRGFTTFNYRLIFWYDFWVGRCVVEIVSTMDLLGDYVRVFLIFSPIWLWSWQLRWRHRIDFVVGISANNVVLAMVTRILGDCLSVSLLLFILLFFLTTTNFYT